MTKSLIAQYFIMQIVPILLIIAGTYMVSHITTRKTAKIGYRSVRAFQSEESWQYAQKECGKLWKKLGWITLVISLLVGLLLLKIPVDLQGIFTIVVMFLQMGILLYTNRTIENRLKEHYPS